MIFLRRGDRLSHYFLEHSNMKTQHAYLPLLSRAIWDLENMTDSAIDQAGQYDGARIALGNEIENMDEVLGRLRRGLRRIEAKKNPSVRRMDSSRLPYQRA